mmetsp:Transcript_9607/g.37400  ORF Transcript_9607/g.37400 Transcript_9607/m.37400 type:complete len:281 (+) Transcript_9607:574-1416(+)
MGGTWAVRAAAWDATAATMPESASCAARASLSTRAWLADVTDGVAASEERSVASDASSPPPPSAHACSAGGPRPVRPASSAPCRTGGGLPSPAVPLLAMGAVTVPPSRSGDSARPMVWSDLALIPTPAGPALAGPMDVAGTGLTGAAAPEPIAEVSAPAPARPRREPNDGPSELARDMEGIVSPALDSSDTPHVSHTRLSTPVEMPRKDPRFTLRYSATWNRTRCSFGPTLRSCEGTCSTKLSTNASSAPSGTEQYLTPQSSSSRTRGVMGPSARWNKIE